MLALAVLDREESYEQRGSKRIGTFRSGPHHSCMRLRRCLGAGAAHGGGETRGVQFAQGGERMRRPRGLQLDRGIGRPQDEQGKTQGLLPVEAEVESEGEDLSGGIDPSSPSAMARPPREWPRG